MTPQPWKDWGKAISKAEMQFPELAPVPETSRFFFLLVAYWEPIDAKGREGWSKMLQAGIAVSKEGGGRMLVSLFAHLPFIRGMCTGVYEQKQQCELDSRGSPGPPLGRPPSPQKFDDDSKLNHLDSIWGICITYDPIIPAMADIFVPENWHEEVSTITKCSLPARSILCCQRC